MASLNPGALSRYVDMRNGTTIGIHFVTLLSTSDTLTVPKLAQRVTNSVSSSALRRPDGFTATVTDNAATADTTASGGNTVTVVGTPGQEILIVTVHNSNVVNFGAEV
jgi:hypothetical protein